MLKNGNMLESQTASIKSSLVSKQVVNTGLLFGNSSQCAMASTPSLSLIALCASGRKHFYNSSFSRGISFPTALPPNLISHSSQTRNVASNARDGGGSVRHGLQRQWLLRRTSQVNGISYMAMVSYSRDVIAPK